MISFSIISNLSGLRKNSETLMVKYSINSAKSSLFLETLSKYATKEVSEEMVNAMRAEFKAEGLESLMPLAISKVLG